MLFDSQYGYYQLIANIEEEGLTFEWRNYPSKRKGGKYANYCSNGVIEFHNSPAIRDKRLPNFIKEQGIK